MSLPAPPPSRAPEDEVGRKLASASLLELLRFNELVEPFGSDLLLLRRSLERPLGEGVADGIVFF